MKYLYAAILVIIGVCDTAHGVSVVVLNHKVYVDNKPVDLSKLQVIKETDAFKTYELHSGESTIKITKSKLGNGITVQTVGPMTPEEREKMLKMQQNIGKKVENDIAQVQQNINLFSQQLNERMNKMNQQISQMFTSSFPFF